MDPVITLRDFSAGWGTRCVTSDLQLNVVRGETLCIVGPGGTGKSTLLRVIEMLATANTPEDAVPLWWRGVGLVTANSCSRLNQHGCFARAPATEVLHAAGLTLEQARERIPPRSSDLALLDACLTRPLDEAPDLVRRYLSFMITAASDAPLLLFDEPLFGLADPWLAAVRERLEELVASRSRTIVIVTHYLPLARRVADLVALLIDGRLIESGPTEDFFCRPEQLRTQQYLKWGA